MENFPCEERLLSLTQKKLKFLVSCHLEFVENAQERNQSDAKQLGIHTLEDPDFSLYRYLRLWLPLVAKNAIDKNECTVLIPLLDISWLWHIHRLIPTAYLRTCKKLVDKDLSSEKVLEIFEMKVHLLKFTTENDEETLTESIWKKYYPNVSFYKEQRAEKTVDLFEGCSSKFLDMKTRLLNSSENQRGFLYQVSRPLFRDPEVLKSAYDDYLKFLLLIADRQSTFNVPRYDIDLMWHTHMTTSPLNYFKNCIEIVGFHIPHDDSQVDRSEGSNLSKAYAKTQKFWKEKYGEDYPKPGRGFFNDPPLEFFLPENKTTVHEELCPKRVFEPQVISVNLVETEEELKKQADAKRSQEDIRLKAKELKTGGTYETRASTDCCCGTTVHEYY
eukprot:snap_masked-scaffold_51-processed-gene-1.40-mRNA-1 protein AED:1.00 eAED:1.00 QI:0/-1/0/0/-1/1/1/0/387